MYIYIYMYVYTYVEQVLMIAGVPQLLGVLILSRKRFICLRKAQYRLEH